MKTLILVVAAMVLAAVCALDARAAGSSKPHKHHGKRHDRQTPPARGALPTSPGNNGWRAYDTSELPFGSRSWWDQMLREGRLNSDTK
jgi:hypothetical protein